MNLYVAADILAAVLIFCHNYMRLYANYAVLICSCSDLQLHACAGALMCSIIHTQTNSCAVALELGCTHLWLQSYVSAFIHGSTNVRPQSCVAAPLDCHVDTQLPSWAAAAVICSCTHTQLCSFAVAGREVQGLVDWCHEKFWLAKTGSLEKINTIRRAPRYKAIATILGRKKKIKFKNIRN